jgi:hypothetical protein
MTTTKGAYIIEDQVEEGRKRESKFVKLHILADRQKDGQDKRIQGDI